MTDVWKQERARSTHDATPPGAEPPAERDLQSDPTPSPDPSPLPDPNLPAGPAGPEPLPGVIPPRPSPGGETSSGPR